MHNKAPLFIFLATFLTFLVATAALVVLDDPERFGVDLEKYGLDFKKSPKSSSGRRGAVTSPRSGAAESDGNSTAAVDEGRATSSFSGKLIDAEGEPIPRASVSIIATRAASQAKDETAKILLTAESEENGEFLGGFSHEEGAVQVVVRAPGYGRWKSEKKKLQEGSAFEVGQITLGPGRDLVVTVQDESGRPISGASVVVRDPNDEWPKELLRPDLSAASGSTGVTQLSGADFGEYVILVTKDGFSPAAESITHEAAMTSGGVTTILAIASSYIEGKVQDSTGRPVRVGEVIARPMNQEFIEGMEVRAPITDQGKFRLGPVAAAKFEIEVDIPGMSQRARIRAEGNGSPIKIVVDYQGTISGTLNTETNVRSAILTLLRCDERGVLLPVNGPKGRVLADQKEFVFESVPPGSYFVRVAVGSWAPARSQQIILGDGEKLQSVEISIGEGGSISGVLQNARGQALNDVQITAFEGEAAPPPAMAGLFLGSSQIKTKSNKDGFFSVKNLSPGPQVIVLEAPGVPARTIGPVLVEEKGELRLGTFLMGGGGSITGTVSGASGKPVAGAVVLVRSEDSSTWLLMQTNADGSFTLRGLNAGAFLVGPASSDPTAEEEFTRLELGRGEHLRCKLRVE